MKLYPTPPSILTLVTWVPQSRLAFGHSARRLAIGPSALAKPNPTVCSLACRWRLRSALRANRESFSIETHALCLILGVLYTVQKICCPRMPDFCTVLRGAYMCIVLVGKSLHFITFLIPGG